MEGIILLGNRKIESFMREIVIDSLDRLILPSIEREVRNIKLTLVIENLKFFIIILILKRIVFYITKYYS